MPVQLKDINGSELLPQEISISRMEILHPNWQDHRKMGINEAVDQLNHCAISLDEEAIIDVMVLGIKDETYRSQVRDYAKAICQNAGKIIKIEKI